MIGYVPEGSSGLLKLRLARREGRELVYVGRVGTGWNRKSAGEIRRVLEPLARPTAALAKPLKRQDTTWVEPRFDAEITYAEILTTAWCVIRHSSGSSNEGRDTRAMLKKSPQGEPNEGLYPNGR